MSKPEVICKNGAIVKMPTRTIRSLVVDAMQHLHQAWHQMLAAQVRGLDASRLQEEYRSAGRDWRTIRALPGCDRRLVRSIVSKYYWRKRHWPHDADYPTGAPPALRRAMAG